MIVVQLKSNVKNWEKVEEIADKIQGLSREKTTKVLLEEANRIEGTESNRSPLTPSSPIPVYLKPNQEKKRKKSRARRRGGFVWSE
jgi:hypothetical protein